MAKILVVDDEKLIVKGIRFSLEQDGMEVDCAYDGEEAINLAKQTEVKARIKAIMRRNSKKSARAKEAENKMVTAGDLKLDREGRRVFIGEKEINLTAKEFDLLELLVCNPNKVYSRESLLTFVWGNKALESGDVRTVDVHVRRLREKIEPSPSDPKYVHTKWGVGYYFRA